MRIVSMILGCSLLLACSPTEQPSKENITAGGQDRSVALQIVTFLDIQSTVPADWQPVTPSSNMRLVQYSIPGEHNAGMIVFYFGPGQGGTIEANINRWVNQFRLVEGKPVKPEVSYISTAGGFDVTWVDIQGDYARGVGMGPVGEYLSSQTLIAAITKTHKGNLYIQMHGDTNAVKHHYDDFLSFVKALRIQTGNG